MDITLCMSRPSISQEMRFEKELYICIINVHTKESSRSSKGNITLNLLIIKC